MSFSSLGLKAELLRAVSEQGYTEPTPVQARAIPVILAGRDVLAGAQTGTGKTAAFALPILHNLSAAAHGRGNRPIRALVLSPTRELTAQVHEDFRTYGRYVPLRTTTVYGGVSIRPQIQALRQGVDILVATPGRLQDHADQGTVNLKHVEVLVLDEADRMLDMGFLPAIRRIMGLLPASRQNLLFSATYSREIRTLAAGILKDPETIQIEGNRTTADNVAHSVYPVDKDRKRELLRHLIESNDWRQVLVFTRMKHGAEKLAKLLDRDGLRAGAIHGNKSQGQRTRALRDFKSGALRVLVATDVASRGLDIEQLPHVVNFELPMDAESYVHRIGRTGRAGLSGEAVSLVCAEEKGLLADIEKLIRQDIPRIKIPGFEPDPNVSVAALRKPGGRNGGQGKPKRQGNARNRNAGGGAQHWHRHADSKGSKRRRNRPSA